VFIDISSVFSQDLDGSKVMVKIESIGKTDVGLIRKNNEDAFCVHLENGFYLVADGMGGAAAGEYASKIFVEAAIETFSSINTGIEEEIIEKIQRSFWAANSKILEHTKKNPQHKGMGCTAELLAFSDGRFILGHMGDSRTYQFRNSQFKQLTKDHSLIQDQIDQGLIEADQAISHSMRNVILRAVGVDENLELDIIRGNAFAGDLYLLCSDGLTDMVDDTSIAKVLSTQAGLTNKVEMLIDLAISAGGKDNITVVLAEAY